MAKPDKKSYQQKHFPQERDSAPGQHALKARLALYKVKKRRLESDSGLEDWPEADLKTLLYEMSTENNPRH